MFGFLNSTLLFAAAAALIPLIIHLFSKRRRKIIEFSSVQHLQAKQRRQIRRIKIRQLLLLLLRMLIILLVVFAFARPTSKSGVVGSHASVSAVILFDNSASMNRQVVDGSLFEIAKVKTSDLLKTFHQSDQVCLIPLAESINSITFSSPSVLESQLEQIGISNKKVKLDEALNTTKELLESSFNLGKEIYIISDRQQSTLPENSILEDIDASIYYVELPIEKVENAGIISLSLGGQLIQAGHDFEMTVTIKNYGNENLDDQIASLYIDGRRVSQTSYEIEGNSETVVRFERSVSKTGFHSGYVEITDDKFIPDNRYYFSFTIPEQFSMLLIDGDESSRFIKLALAPTGDESGYWSVKDATVDQLAGVRFENYDIIVISGAPVLSDSYLNRLKGYVQRGNSIFITYGGNTNIESFNDLYSSFSGVEYTKPVRKDFTRAGYYSLQFMDLSHPIFSVFGLDQREPPQLKFFTLPEFSILDSTDILMRFTGDRPALIEKKLGNGKVLTFTGPMSPIYTDLVSHGFFVPFISRIVEYLASDLSALDLHLTTDQQIVRTLSGDYKINQSIVMLSPNGNRYLIPPSDKSGSISIHATPTDEIGVYRLSDNGREIDRFAVSLDKQEADLTMIDIDRFNNALGIDEYTELKSDANYASVIADSRVGKELWQIFLWIAVILLAIEMLLGRGRSARE